MNTIYTILTNNTPVDYCHYGRAVDKMLEFSADPAMADALVLPSGDTGYIAFQASMLCEICAASSLSGSLLKLDPENTYRHRIPAVSPEFGVSGEPVGVSVTPVDNNITYPWNTLRFVLEVDPGSDSYKVEVGNNTRQGTLGVVSGVSRVIDIDSGFGVWLSGVGSTRFTLTGKVVRQPARDINDIVAAVTLVKPSYEASLAEGSSLTDIIAGWVLDHCVEALG